MAYVLNPYSTPTALEDGMREEAVVCFKTFFGENTDKPHLAENELDCLLERNGQLGRRVTSCQEWTSTLENPNPSDIDHLDLFRKHFNAEDDGVAFRIWNTVGRQECPHLAELAVRLMELSVQNASIERICKGHSLIHTKVRNMLASPTQQKLLYIYINERLMDIKSPIAEFVVSSIDYRETDDDDNDDGEG